MELSKSAEALLRLIGKTERCEMLWRNGIREAAQELVAASLAQLVLMPTGTFVELTDDGIDAADDLADEDAVNKQFNEGRKR